MNKASKVRIAFYQPDIPQNLGAAVRLAACFGVSLDIIEPCGFPLTEKAIRRSAMDYGAHATVCRHDGWESYVRDQRDSGKRLVLFTTTGAIPLSDFAFRPGDSLLFGRESAGVPSEVMDEADERVIIPMTPPARSMNVVMSAGIGLWEAVRQLEHDKARDGSD